MGRGAASAAKTQLGLANTQAADSSKVASSALAPTFAYNKQQLSNPTGYSPEDLANMLTSSSQSLGGSMSAANGQGALATARTRNGAGYSTALDNAARGAMQQDSQNALQVQNSNAQLKQQKQQTAANNLQSLYGTAMGNTLSALGVGNGSIGQWNQADQNTLSSIMAPINVASNLASAYMGMKGRQG